MQTLQFNNPTFESLESKEWLVTNGLGGYASSTLSGANSRRYHGLFVPALNPPTSRTVMVSKLEERMISTDGNVFALSSNRYPGAIHPDGYQYLVAFERLPIPTFHSNAGGHTIRKRIAMPYGSNTTIVEYTNTGDIAFDLELSPRLVHRDYHSLYRENTSENYWTEWKSERNATFYAHYGAPALHMSFNKGLFRDQPEWYRNFEYAKEKYRGLDFQEDSFSPGHIRVSLNAGESCVIVFTVEESVKTSDPQFLLQAEIDRIKTIGESKSMIQLNGSPVSYSAQQQFYKDLLVAADQFIVQRKSSGGHTLIAGYHWFTDWGRDTMIAMRGLVIAPGKKDLAESIIDTFLQYLDGGMLPNRFPDSGEIPEYNTIDATLWLFIVLHEYAEKFADWKYISSVFPKLTAILEAHTAGTRYDIHMTEEGLLFGGEGLSQLTWMDARIGDHVVTPRQGCPVEVNALWYNALRIYNAFAQQLGLDSAYMNLPEKIKSNFNKYFYNGSYLNDVVIPGEYTDDAIRPNQIYALSLPYPLLDAKKEKKILKCVTEKLLTPLGLRSLDPAHPDFIATYGGDQWHRDTAYHQGTVWTFLMGEYMLAYLRVHGFSSKAVSSVLKMTEPLMQHFYSEDCLHGISEIFDGLTPGTGRGCVQQAWSIGMLLKVLSDLQTHAVKQPAKKSPQKS